MEKYPDYQTYRALYARYFDGGRSVVELLQLLQPLRGVRLLDLCAGEGWVTIAALDEYVREVVLVDQESAMIPADMLDHPQVRVQIMPVRDALLQMHVRSESVDRIVCRQALNYWLNPETAKLAADVLAPRGILAFNTFNERPSEKPYVREYKLGDHSFVEVSWLIGDTVHHVQVREGMAPHHTSFKWLSPRTIRQLLELYFDVDHERRGKTSLYKCMKK